MKIIGLSQEEGSNEEWLSFRNFKISASRSFPLMDVDKYEYTRLKMFDDIMGIGELFIGNEDTRRGTELEPIARDMLNTLLEEDFEPAVVIHEKMDYFMSSLDGLNSSCTAIAEFKSPNPLRPNYISKRFGSLEEFKEYLPHHYNQVQHQLATCPEVHICYFCTIWRGELEYIIIPRDNNYIAKLEKEAKKFYDNHIATGNEPKKSKGDFIFIEEEEIPYELIIKAREIDERQKELAGYIKEYKTLDKEKKEVVKQLSEFGDDLDFFIGQDIKMIRTAKSKMDLEKVCRALNITEAEFKEKYYSKGIGYYSLKIEGN